MSGRNTQSDLDNFDFNVSQGWHIDPATKLARPIFMCPLECGSPAAGEGWIQGEIDLNRYLIKNWAPERDLFDLRLWGVKPKPVVIKRHNGPPLLASACF